MEGAESLKCSLRLAADGMTEGKVGVSTPIVCYRAERVGNGGCYDIDRSFAEDNGLTSDSYLPIGEVFGIGARRKF